MSWLPSSVYSAGGGRSSVEACYSTALDIEEDLSGFTDSDVHVFVADVVDREGGPRLWCLGVWVCLCGFVKAYFGYHAGVRLRFKLSCGLGEPSA